MRRTYETDQEQTPVLFGEANAGIVVADLGKLLGPGGELLDPGRMKRVVFRAESAGRVKDLAGFRKTHTLPDRANEWARKYVNRIAAADIKADLDNIFDMVREQFGYKRKDLDVSAERDGLGFIRTPDFEYTVTLAVNPDEPTDVIWRREIGRLSGPENIFVFRTKRYARNPLVVSGPGAGPEVTAAGAFADIIRIARAIAGTS